MALGTLARLLRTNRHDPIEVAPQHIHRNGGIGGSRRAPRALAFGLALVVVACAQNGGRDSLLSERTDRVFLAGLQEISDLYIEPVELGPLAVAGLDGLKSVDPAVRVSRDGAVVRIVGERGPIRELPVPEPRNIAAWAGVMTAAVESARASSPKLSAATSEAVYEAVLGALVGGLDRFSRYAAAEAAREQRATRDGFGGIGVTINVEDGVVRILSVIEGGPAAGGGVRVDDRIVAIDDVSTASMAQRDVVQRLRGRIDTPVVVTIARDGATQPIAITLTRSRIVVPTIKVEHIGPFAHIRIMSFNQQTGRKLTEALEELMGERGSQLRGIILDLRSNPGGLLDQAVRVADAFLTDGPIIATRGRHPASNQSFEAGSRDLSRGVPLVVLINGASASAAEIVAAALQDRGRAVVVGSASFGKGTVQTVMRLPNDGELTLTWARLLSPQGYLLHDHGVIPTVCTNGLENDVASLRQGLQREAKALAGAKSRAKLDEAGWKSLRDSCTGQSKEVDTDVKLAERLLADPGLYSRALRLSMAAVGNGRTTAALPDRGRKEAMRP